MTGHQVAPTYVAKRRQLLATERFYTGTPLLEGTPFGQVEEAGRLPPEQDAPSPFPRLGDRDG